MTHDNFFLLLLWKGLGLEIRGREKYSEKLKHLNFIYLHLAVKSEFSAIESLIR